MAQRRYFHVGPSGLLTGQRLEPGRFGNAMRRFGPGSRGIRNHSEAINLIWETTLEALRTEIAPHAPSRFHCHFACPTFDEAHLFRTKYRKDYCVYEIIVDDTTPVFAGNMDLLSKTKARPYVDMISENARLYWQGTTNGTTELLIGGPIEIVCMLDGDFTAAATAGSGFGPSRNAQDGAASY